VGLPSTIIVIGASAGGLSPLKTIVSQLSTGIDAAVFAVQHVDPAGPALLAEVLGRESSLPVTTQDMANSSSAAGFTRHPPAVI
jgi:chemotaxis response regulator CheB